MTVSMTDSAAKQIQTQLGKRGHGVGLRVGIKKVGCSGFAYTYEYADEIKDGDVVSEHNGARLVVAGDSAEFLAGAQLDFVRDGLKQTFKFNNPNVDATCGCGESFSFKGAAATTAKA